MGDVTIGSSSDTQNGSRPRTGDVVLMSNLNGYGSLIQTVTGFESNHTGIYVEIEVTRKVKLPGSQDYTKVKRLIKGIFHSDCEPRDDELTGRRKAGCQLVSLDSLKHDYAKLSYRPIKVVRDHQFYEKTVAFMLRYSEYEYDSRPLALIGAAMGKETGEELDSSVFCSSLVAKYLMEIGLIPTCNSNLFSPGLFSSESKEFDPLFESKEILIYKNGENFQKSAVTFIFWLTIILFIFLILLGVMRKRRHW